MKSAVAHVPALDSLRLGEHNALSFECVFYVRLVARTALRPGR